MFITVTLSTVVSLKFEDLSTEELDGTKQKGEEKEKLVLLGLTYVSTLFVRV